MHPQAEATFARASASDISRCETMAGHVETGEAMTDAIKTPAGERLSVGDIELEVVRRGTGRPVLLLHGMQQVDPRARFLDLLGRRAEVIVPSHPGFGRSARPADFDSVYDLVHLYLDVLDALPYERV